MWRDRITRFLIIVLVTVLVLVLAKALSQGLQNSETSSFRLPIKEKIEALSEKVLGTAVKKLPRASDSEGVEPIEKPVRNIQNLADELVESIKKLPQDQIEAVKKQIYKKLSEELSGN